MANFTATSGDNTFNGTAGASDTVDYSGSGTTGSHIVINLSLTGPQVIDGSGKDTFVSIENIIGSAFDDTVSASGGVHTFSMGAGNDEMLTTGAGVWTLDGGADVDDWTGDYSAGTSNLTFSYDGANGSGTLTGGTTLSHIERVGITFGSGNDTATIVHGLSAVGNGGSYLTGGAGNDSFTLDGFRGINNVLNGGADSDTLTLNLQGSATTAQDTFISKSASGNSFALNISGTASLQTDAFEHIVYTADDGDNRVSINGLPTLGTGVSLHIDAAGGSDNLSMDLGEAGHETANVNWTITGSVTTASNVGLYDHFESIDLYLGSGTNILHMGDEADTIHSTAGQDSVFGGGGNDMLVAEYNSHPAVAVDYHGGSGDDQLIGGDANDVLAGDAGADYLDGGMGSDTADYSSASAGLAAYLSAAQLNTGDAAGDGYIRMENLSGSAFADILSGDAGSNTLWGNDGNDWLAGTGGSDNLQGGTGNDVLDGGTGADRLDGGAGLDVASYRNATAGVTLDLGNAANNAGEAAGDTLTNIENLWGSNYNDTLRSNLAGGGQVYGFAGNDTLAGSGGNDVFYGGTGADTITTGAGADDLFFLSYYDHTNASGTVEPNEGGDTITDFAPGQDHVTVSRYWFGFGNIGGPAAALTSTNADFITSGTTAASTRPTFFWDQATGVLGFDPDGTGTGTVVTLATFSNGAALHLSDIWTA